MSIRLTVEEIASLECGDVTISDIKAKREAKKLESNKKHEQYVATKKARREVMSEKNIQYVPIGSALKSNDSLAISSIVDKTRKKVAKFNFFGGTGYYKWDGVWAYVQGKLNSKTQNAYPVNTDEDVELALTEAVESYNDFLINGKQEEIEEVNGFSF